MISLAPLANPPVLPRACPNCDTPLTERDRVPMAVEVPANEPGILRRYRRWDGALCPRCRFLTFASPETA